MKTTIPLYLISPSEEFKEQTNHLMKVFCSAERYAFQRLVEGESPSDINKRIQDLFDLNKRYAEDDVLLAKATIDSQKELLPLHMEDTEAKINKTKQKILLYSTGKRKPKKVDLAACLKGLNARLQKYEEKLSDLQEHQKNNTFPSVIFGGKKNFYKRMEGKISHEEWRDLRSNHIYSRGDKSKQGNLNLRVVFVEGKFFLEVAIPFGVEKGMESPRVRAEIHVPDRYFDQVVRTVLPDQGRNAKGKPTKMYTPYTVKLIRKNQVYQVHLTFEEETSGREYDWKEPVRGERIAGIDVNIDRIAVTIMDQHGNYLTSKVFYCHEMEDASSNKRTNCAGDTARWVVDWLLDQQVEAIVLEDITLKQQHDTNKCFNRRTSSFAKNKLLSSIQRRALRYGLKVKWVNPAYTSVVGKFKYKRMYGLSVHESAALAIGRRGMGLEEKLPRTLIQALKEKIKPHLISKLGSMEETEKESVQGKKKRQLFSMWLRKIETFKQQHPWSLWNIVHKCLIMKQHQIQIKEI